MSYHTSRVSIYIPEVQARVSNNEEKNEVPVHHPWAIRYITPLRREHWDEINNYGNPDVSDSEREKVRKYWT